MTESNESRAVRAAQIAAKRHRRAEIAKLLLRGYSDRRLLAQQFGVTPKVICRDIQWIDEQWRIERLTATEQRKGRMLAELELIRRESLIAWSESKKPLYEETTTTDPKGKVTLKVRKGGTRAGDSAHIGKFLDALGKEMAILGIRAPEATDKAQVVNLTKKLQINVGDLSREAVAILCEEIDRYDKRHGIAQPAGEQAEIEAEFMRLETNGEAGRKDGHRAVDE